MRKNIKFLVLSMSAIFAILILSSCNSAKSNTNNVIDVVTVWTPNSHSKGVYNKLVDKFNESTGKEKGVKIVYEVKEGNFTQMIDLAFSSGQAPDIFSGAPVQKLAESGDIFPIDDLPDGKEFLQKYKPYLRNTVNIIKGKTYWVPASATTRGLVYNKEMFVKAGLVDENGEAKPPETFDEVRSYAKILTNPAKKEYGIVIPLKWGGWFGSDVQFVMQSSVGHVGYNPAEGIYDFSGIKPIMNMYMGIKEDGSCLPGAEGLDNDPARARFSEGGIGMKFAASFDVGVFNDQFPAKFKWGVASLPVADKNKKFKQEYDIGGDMLINSKVVERIGGKKVMDVYKFFLSDEFIIETYKAGVSIPYDWNIVKDIKLEDSKNGWKEFCQLTAISAQNPVSIKYDISGQVMLKDIFVNGVWQKKISVDEAVDKYTQTVNNGMKKYAEIHPEYDGSEFIIKDWNIAR